MHPGDDAPRAEPTGKEDRLLQEGEILDGVYLIKQLLGAGGMGEVYEAEDRRMNRRVAIKISRVEVGDAPLIGEAQALAAFRDPALPTVFFLGRHQGRHYLAMEKLVGGTLADTMKRFGPDRPMPWREAIEILSGIGKALAPIHAAGLAHRDLKPGNIMLVPPSRVVLMDFGIVRQERHMVDQATISGSPAYMAPEVIRRNIRVGEAHLTDLYSLGVIAFELATGRLPVDGTSTEKILAGQLEQPVPRTPLKTRGLPPGLDTLIFKLLQKDPDDRSDSVATVLSELDRLRAGA